MNKKGKLTVVDGMDGAGKKTQTRLLKNRLEAQGLPVILLEFPNYENYSSIMVKKYLAGDYANAKKSVDNLTFIKQMSSFYSVDRVATFLDTRQDGKTLIEHLNDGTHIICDRYTTSNILHQSANIDDQEDVLEYVGWMQDLEYRHLGIPRPTQVIYLNVSPEVAIANITKRYAGSPKEDIHENLEHLTKVSNIKQTVIQHCGWTELECCKKGILLPKPEIHDMIYKIVSQYTL